MSKKLYALMSVLIVFSFVLAACTTPAVPAGTDSAAQPAATEAPAAEAPAAAEASTDANALPRNETLYFNGQQWGPVVG